MRTAAEYFAKGAMADGDILNFATKARQEFSAPAKISERVNRIKYPKKNTLGLGANVRKPTPGQITKALGNHLAPVEFGHRGI